MVLCAPFLFIKRALVVLGEKTKPFYQTDMDFITAGGLGLGSILCRFLAILR